MDTFRIAAGLPAAALLIALGPTSALAQNFQQKITPADQSGNAFFGGAVGVHGDSAIVGAVGYDDRGAAYLFERSEGVWDKKAILVASDGAFSDQFGVSVAVGDNVAIVGAWGADGAFRDQGAAYIFERFGSAWIQTAKLIATQPADFNNFGRSVAVSGNMIIVGTGDSANQGSAYVFVREGGDWIFDARLTAADGAPADWFGWSVAISESRVLVGASRASGPGGLLQGYAYVFVRGDDQWEQEAELAASDAAPQGVFGAAVALSGDTAVVGGHDGTYVFERSGANWTEMGKLSSPDSANFGAIAICGDSLVAGNAFDHGPAGAGQGAVYFFARSNGSWELRSKRNAFDGRSGDKFGGSVAVSEDSVVVGANILPPQGASYLFGLGSGCPMDIDGDGFVGSSDLALLIGAWGSTLRVVADLNGDGIVSAGDVALLLSAWGVCR